MNKPYKLWTVAILAAKFGDKFSSTHEAVFLIFPNLVLHLQF